MQEAGGETDACEVAMTEPNQPNIPEFAEKDQPLRRDVHELGALLGHVLTEQGGPTLFERVETARVAARARREGDATAGEKLAGIVQNLTPADADELVRAFSAYFNVVNMAEQVHRIRRRRDYQRSGPQPDSLEAVLQAMKAAGHSLADVRRHLSRLRIEPVFTAHPTEAVRRTLLVKQQRIARALVERIEPETCTPPELKAIENRLRHEITVAWQTDEHLRTRPTVADEVEHILFYVSEVLFRVVPAFYEALENALEAVFGDGAASDLPAEILRIGSWVGGDMDGNPNVGADTIRTTLLRHRELALRHYRQATRDLFDQLSQSRGRVAVDDSVIERGEHYRQLLPAAYEAIPERYREMPYRVLLWLIHARIEATEADKPDAYASAAELIADMHIIRGSLLAHGGRHAGEPLVRRFIQRVETFGFHLATLDVRQDSLVHRRVVGRLLGDDAFANRSRDERTKILAGILKSASPADLPPLTPEESRDLADDETRQALAVMQAIRQGRERFGERAIGPYIISMAQGPDDALAVIYLAMRGGLVDADGRVPVDVAPLFETVDDLANSRDTLAALLAEPLYRTHLAARGNEQFVMLGYSDSNKDSGIAASRWALYRAETALVEVADAAGAELILFHGRGGSISRGGGKTREAVLAQPPGTVRGRLRLTEQGEIIHAKYGLRGIATRTLELMTGAVLQFSADEATAPRPNPAWMAALSRIADESRSAYRAMVVDDPDLVEYFQLATPLDVIQRLLIGSRPASRRKGAGIADLRAIPWVFAWTQSRHILPGWFGFGAGLSRAKAEFGLETLRAMARQWRFFATLLGDVEMVMAKADMPIAARYAELAGEVGARVFPRISAAFDATRAIVCEVHGIADLLEREPVLRRNIRLRNPYVDPMSLVQIDLLRRWRDTNREDPALENALFTTVKGIARGLQNTG